MVPDPGTAKPKVDNSVKILELKLFAHIAHIKVGKQTFHKKGLSMMMQYLVL